MHYKLLAISLAYLLDLIFGDPQFSFHPVRLIGKMIERLTVKLNREPAKSLVAGGVLLLLVVAVTVFSVWLTLWIAMLISPVLYWVIWALLLYFALSTKALAVEVSSVSAALRNGNIQEARESLSMIVGRDTQGLSQPEIIRACVETAAESTMDGIVAPLFYAFLGGPALAWAYKAINTLDSMVGYKNERFINFGRLSARMDATANFIPAKITALLISVSSLFCAKDWLGSLECGWKYLFKGPHANSEATEAAMAGALKVKLGGLNFYNSVPARKPDVGSSSTPLRVEHIGESMQIAYISSALMLILGLWVVVKLNIKN